MGNNYETAAFFGKAKKSRHGFCGCVMPKNTEQHFSPLLRFFSVPHPIPMTPACSDFFYSGRHPNFMNLAMKRLPSCINGRGKLVRFLFRAALDRE
jgi:hypothetical protein